MGQVLYFLMAKVEGQGGQPFHGSSFIKLLLILMREEPQVVSELYKPSQWVLGHVIVLTTCPSRRLHLLQRLWDFFLQAAFLQAALMTAQGKCQAAKCPEGWTNPQWLMWFIRRSLPAWVPLWVLVRWGDALKEVWGSMSLLRKGAVWSSCWRQDLGWVDHFESWLWRSLFKYSLSVWM